MPVRKEDEIMAEHLLKGGKMLEKSCKTCGCPLFEVKGKTLCVVCAEKGTTEKTSPPATAAPAGRLHDAPCSCGEHHEGTCVGGGLADELAMTIVSLCERIQNEKDPDNVLALMNAVKAGTEALQILCQL
jgi:UPF0148 protein